MTSINEMLNKIYSNIINIILKDFEEEEKILVQQEYIRILKNRYSNLNITNYEKVYEKLYKLEYNEWNNLSINAKKQILLKDEVLDEIKNISSKAYENAKERLKNNKSISKEEAEQSINKLNELLTFVKEYNKDLARWHISEGIMDLKYASLQTNNTSMRISHIK